MLKLLLARFVLILSISGHAFGASKETTAQEESTSEARALKETSTYVHEWVKFPELTGRNLEGGGDITIGCALGKACVVFFLSTHSVHSQKIIERYKKLSDRFSNLHTDFFQVFVNDTVPDARAFHREFKLRNSVRAALNSEDLNLKFHAQTVPLIYVGDRYGWIVTRYPITTGSGQEINEEMLDDFENLLQHLNAF
jgi:hypothetical protein